MSHSIASPGPAPIFKILTIIDYATGGEAIAAAEIDPYATGVTSVFFATVAPSQNSLAAPLFPLLNAGKVMLFRFVAGVPTEIPGTVALNAVISAIVQVVYH